jgi:hypothetical protein
MDRDVAFRLAYFYRSICTQSFDVEVGPVVTEASRTVTMLCRTREQRRYVYESGKLNYNDCAEKM